MFCYGKCYPYEYKRYEIPQPPADFVAELGDILEEKGITDLVGIQTYTGGIVGIENTDHDLHVSITVDQDEKEPMPKNMVAASWAFFRV